MDLARTAELVDSLRLNPADTNAAVHRRKGVVTAINAANGTCTVQLAGSSTAVAGLAVLGPYVPAVNDLIWCLEVGGVFLVMGGQQVANWATGLYLPSSLAGNGLSITGTPGILAVNVDGTTIEISSDSLRVKAGGIGANEIATDAVGTSEIAPDAVTATELDSTMVPHKMTTRVQQASGSRSSASYAEVPTRVRVASFVKRLADTHTFVTIMGTTYMTTAGLGYVGVYNQTSVVDVVVRSFNTANNKAAVVGFVDLGALAAGTYTYDIWWHGDGTNAIAVDTADFLTLTVEESF